MTDQEIAVIKAMKPLFALPENWSGTYVGQDMWALLTALRGPDGGSGRYKMATTAVIRHHFFKLMDIGDTGFDLSLPMVSMEDTLTSVRIRVVMAAQYDTPDAIEASAEEVGKHFYSHAVKAFKALGLKWDELNEG